MNWGGSAQCSLSQASGSQQAPDEAEQLDVHASPRMHGENLTQSRIWYQLGYSQDSPRISMKLNIETAIGSLKESSRALQDP